ncbi:MAG TPA: glycosyltransferase family 39 protein [Blastocatellia bacterium]|nr:glycosyltransferase family 39 protein [Blastocatellia bacterium]
MRGSIEHFREWLASGLAVGRPLALRTTLILAVTVFLFSFLVKSLHALDLSPVMHTSAQLAGGMTSEYDRRAVSITAGHGVLIPDDDDSSDTCLLAHAPGYSIFLSLIYRVFGRRYLTVQQFQNLLNSISPVLPLLIVGRTLSWRVGTGAALLAAGSHHLSYYSNFVLPDSLSSLPILIGALLAATPTRNRRATWRFAAAGIALGFSAWLRANSLLLPVWAGLVRAITGRPRRHAFLNAAILVGFWFLTVTPTTVRNYLIFREFVPIQIGFGITLWEGIGDTDHGRFGGPRSDADVIAREAAEYDDPNYGYSWSTPDGIQRDRDRDRVKRCLAIISAHPFWFTGSAFVRAETGIQYNTHAPLVFRKDDRSLAETGVAAREQLDEYVRDALARGEWALAAGELFELSRPVIRVFQRIAKEPMQIFVVLGGLAVLAVSRRAALVMIVVPGYYLLIQSILHTEFRYTLPMQYFLFSFAAATWCLIGAAVFSGAGLLKAKLVTNDKGRVGSTE